MENLPVKNGQTKEVLKERAWIMNGADYDAIRIKIGEMLSAMGIDESSDESQQSDIDQLLSDVSTLQEDVSSLQEDSDAIKAVKKYKAVITQESTEISSGSLTVGTVYQIKDYNATDDFTNLGASANENDAYFTVGDISGTVAHTQSNRVAVKQKDTVTLTGTGGAAQITVAGGLTKTFQFNTSLSQTATDFVTNNAAAYLAQGIVVTADSADLIFEAQTAGTGFSSPVITNVPFDLDGTIVNTQANVAAVKQKDTVTLTGTSGTASITNAGLESRIATWNTSLTQTATDFVTAYAADYLAEGVVVTSDGADIIFEASTAGTPFDTPDVLNASGNLDGTIENTVANVVAVAKIDTMTLSGTIGFSDVVNAGGLTKRMTFNTSLTQTATDFVTNHAAAYLGQDIIVTADGEDIIFTANVAGTTFTSPDVTLTAGNLAGSVAHTQANVTAQKQIETLTLTGESGTNAIYTAGGLTKNVIFNADLDTTAADFVTDHAAAYLAQGIVVTSSEDDIIFTANVAGTSFSAPLIYAASTPADWSNNSVLIYDFEPVVTEIENTVGNIIWMRYTEGVYGAYLLGAFPASTTFIPAYLKGYYSGIIAATFARGTDDVLFLTSGTIVDDELVPADSILDEFPIEFYVYPTV